MADARPVLTAAEPRGTPQEPIPIYGTLMRHFLAARGWHVIKWEDAWPAREALPHVEDEDD